MVFLVIGSYLCEITNDKGNSLYCFDGLLDFLDEQLKRQFPMFRPRVFDNSIWLLWGVYIKCCRIYNYES